MPTTVYTEDNPTYRFFQVDKHSVTLSVKASNDAHVILSTKAEASAPFIEIFLGGWENSKSAIRLNNEKPDKYEVSTPSLLSMDEAKTFVVTWTADGKIDVFIQGASEPFLSWKNDQPFEVRYFGLRTAWNSTGDWKIDDVRELHTEASFDYQWFPVHNANIDFSVQAKSDAHIALTSSAEASNPMYEIFLGGWDNTKCAIRFNQEKPDVAMTEGSLSRDSFQKFWIRVNYAAIKVGRDGEVEPFLSWTNPEPHIISHFGIRTSWGSDGNWILGGGVESNDVSGDRPRRDIAGVEWVVGSAGEIPEGAFVGGDDNGVPLYVIRAEHEGALLPGKLLVEHGVAYVPWGGVENAKDSYQVLVVSPDSVSWVDASGDSVPSNAIEGGNSEDGETLYVGRVTHEGALTVGKFHPSHAKVYISYGGEEVGYEEFQVLVKN